MKRHADKFGRKPNKTLNFAPSPKAEARLKEEKAVKELNAKHPEPMSIFHKREKSGEIPSERLKKPDVTAGQAAKAGEAMAAWDNSDPFAYGRTVLYVKQGYLRSDEVVKEMSQRTLARRVAKSREVDSAKTGQGN